MPTFSYQAYDASGKSVKGRKEGLSVKEIRETLLAEGLYARRVQTVAQSRRKKSFSVQSRSMFFRELGALLKAGLPLDRALEILSEHPELGAGHDVLPLIRDLLKEGQDLSVSLQQHLPGIREDEVAVLAAGEAAGRLPEVSVELADFLEDESKMQDQLKTALVYPAVIILLSVVVLGLLVGFLLPVYEKLLTGLGQDLPALTKGVLFFGRACRHPIGIILFMVLAVGLGLGIRKWIRDPQSILPMKRFKLPIIGFTFSSLARARFARTISLLMDGGVALPEAIQVAGRATGSLWLSLCCNEMSSEISQGKRVVDAVSDLPILQEDLPGWIRAGEASGDLSGMLKHASESHQRAWSRSLVRLLALVEPILIISVGLLILIVALAILLPMLKMNQSLGR
ncbi:type II secretion system F family protein [Kiritimatiellota bacterium B12222]|nr:type II secretion system F family protein [Kiritimatiellota bacterium B12222]